RRFVDATGLRFNDAVLDLVRNSEPVTTTDRVRFVDERHGIVEDDAVDRYRAARFEPYGHLFSGDLDIIAPGSHAHDRLHDVESRVKELELLRLVRCAPDVCVSRVRLFGRIAIRVAVRDEPLAHL